MKTIAFLALAMLSLASSIFGGVIPPFQLPDEIIQLTTPSRLPPAVLQAASPTYAELRPTIAETKYRYAFSIRNKTRSKLVLVMNGKPVNPVDRTGKELEGVLVIDGWDSRSNPPVMPVLYSNFSKYGVILVIGLFELESGNKLGRGYIYAVRLADLLDSKGNLRSMTIDINSIASWNDLAKKEVVCVRPNYKDLKGSPLVAMRPNNRLLAPGETVVMSPFVVNESKAWMTVKKIRITAPKKSPEEVPEIETVVPGKPYAEAGLKVGMIIRRIKLCETDFGDLTGEGKATRWPWGDMIFEVQDDKNSPRREIVVPAESLRRALSRPKAEAVAVAP